MACDLQGQSVRKQSKLQKGCLLEWPQQDGLSHREFNKEFPSMGSGMAQLVERSLPTPEVRGSNPVIRKL